jgi:putative membrane protein
MWLDALLAYLHFTAMFVLFGYLFVENVIIKGKLDAVAIRRIGKIDLIYFGAAIAVLVTGFLRLVYGAKGPDFYLNAWPIYVKIGLFVLVAAISVKPTVTFIEWRRHLDHDPAWKVPPAEQQRMRRLIMLEVHVAGMIPVFAVVMSRGLGHSG